MDFDNSEVYLRIYIINFSFSCIIVFLTLILAIPLYSRILSSKWLFDNYILRLIAVNGIVSIFEFISYVLCLSLGRIPNLNTVIDYLNDSHLNIIIAFFFLHATSAQFLSSLCISINRLFYITNSAFLKRNEHQFFLLSVALSLILPIFVSFPIAFGNVHYKPYITSSGETLYTTTLPEMILLSPFAVFLLITSLASNLCTIIITFMLMKMRISNAVTQKTAFMLSKAEQGLIVSVVVTSFLQLSSIIIGVLAGVFFQYLLGAFLILIVAMFNVMPFWFLIIFVPSLRKISIPATIWRIVKKLSITLTIFNSLFSFGLIYLTTPSHVIRTERTIFSLLAAVPHLVGLIGCMRPIKILIRLYFVFTILNFCYWGIISLYLILTALGYSTDERISDIQDKTLRNYNYTYPVEYYKEKHDQYYVWGRVALIYCVLQIILTCVLFKLRKEIREEERRKLEQECGM